jgi:SNF2 family DNA or RNA helicase
MNALHAEIHADGDRVILFADGPDIAAIAQGLELLTPLIKPTDPPGALQAPLCWPLVVQLAIQYPGVFFPGPRLQAWIAGQVSARMPQDDPESWVPLGNETAFGGKTPRLYQLEGARMLAGTGRGFLFDDPGTGKTITAILAVLRLRAAGVIPLAGPIVVVCPGTVQDSWVRAWREWTTLSAVAWRGTPDQRRRKAGIADVYVVSYATARNDAVAPRKATPTHPRRVAGPLWEMMPSVVIVDECHALKNRDSKQSQVVRSLGSRARAVFALSGTPITHTVRDLWPNMAMVDPAGYHSEERFTSRYVLTTKSDYGEPEALGIQPWRQAEWDMALLGQYRRVSKADVLPQLPPKVYSVREVDLPPEYRKAYDDLEDQMLAELPGEDVELKTMTELSKLELLCRLACAAADVFTVLVEVVNPLTGETEMEERARATLRAPSWKADALVEVLDERPGQQVAVFAPSRQMIDVAHEVVTKAGYRCALIVGGQSATQRTAEVDRFQAGDADVILVTTSAGGVGITLTAASVVVFLQRPWSYVEASQAEDRCHRIGSEIHDSIEIIDIVARRTVDSRVREVLRTKAGALAELVKDPRIVREVLGGAQR